MALDKPLSLPRRVSLSVILSHVLVLLGWNPAPSQALLALPGLAGCLRLKGGLLAVHLPSVVKARIAVYGKLGSLFTVKPLFSRGLAS